MPRRNVEADVRAKAIEVLLLWEGEISRSRLLDLFEVHATVASRDIAAFREAFPDACDPSTATKSFVVRPLFKPKISKGVFGEYQALVGGAKPMGEIRAGVPLTSVRPDVTTISYTMFRQLHLAIREGRCVRISYRSMGTPEKHERVIRPHAMIQALTRWHVRAWCTKARAFRDFNLGRISAAVPAEAGDALGPDEDVAWATEVALRFVPHVGLSREQKLLVRDEYMGGTTALVHRTRAPMVRYVIRAFGAAVNPLREKPPAFLLMVERPEDLPEGALPDAG